jgi:hypothetical protein
MSNAFKDPRQALIYLERCRATAEFVHGWHMTTAGSATAKLQHRRVVDFFLVVQLAPSA